MVERSSMSYWVFSGLKNNLRNSLLPLMGEEIPPRSLEPYQSEKFWSALSNHDDSGMRDRVQCAQTLMYVCMYVIFL